MGRYSLVGFLALLFAVAMATASCSSSAPEASGYKATDFSKRPPPAGFGPNGPGAMPPKK